MASDGNKNRKYGRTARSPAMARYNAENRKVKNKILRVFSHFKRSIRKGATDHQARKWLEENAPRMLNGATESKRYPSQSAMVLLTAGLVMSSFPAHKGKGDTVI